MINPISEYAIRPALKLSNASEHPIRGGIAAALASGVAHYGLAEIVGQLSDMFFDTNFKDPATKTVFMNIPIYVYALFGANMAINFAEGVRRYLSS